MQKVMKSKEFISFKNDLNEVMKKLNELKDDINEDVKVKYNLKKYNEIVEGSDSDVLTQYETWYDQLAEVVINNNNLIKQNNELVQKLEKLNNFINKEKENNDEIKVTLNSLVDKMIDKETFIFNKNEDEFKRQPDKRKHEFDEKLKELNGMKYSYDTEGRNSINELYPNDTSIQQDKEIVELIPSFNKLKEWSGKQKCSIIFDSKIDGDGKGILATKVMNKQNLYFISFDNENNVYGGYVGTIINTIYNCITDPNSFTFSLIRNGEMKNIKYNIRCGQKNAFGLNSNVNNYLYVFGANHNNTNDIVVPKIGFKSFYCSKPHNYEYNGEQQPLRADTNNYYMKRIIVVQMS